MRSLPLAACIGMVSGIPCLSLGQTVNVTAVDDYYTQPQQTDTYYYPAQQPDPYTTQPQPAVAYDRIFGQEELDQMLAPIALYPDSLLSQVLMAATYPLEIVQADRWAKANTHLNADEAARALELEPWDPSVKSLINFPDVLAMLSDRLDWTQQLGDAFLGQPQDVADSIQRLRASAWNSGNLTTTEQQVVYVQQQAPTPIIVIEPATPDIIYVPVYDPFVVYGYWPYPAYPPYRYYPHGHLVTNVISFGFGRHCGFAWGYAWGRWDWHDRDIFVDIDINIGRNSFINPTRYASYSRPHAVWQHDPVHRRTVPYRSDRLARYYGGSSLAQTVQGRESFRGRSTSTLLDRLGSPELARLDERNRESGDRVSREAPSRSSTGTSREPEREVATRTPRGTDTEAARDRSTTVDRDRSPGGDRDRAPTVDRDRSPGGDRDRAPSVDRDRSPSRDNDSVAYVPAQPVSRGDREPRAGETPMTPRVTREPRDTQPVTREPGRTESSGREPARVDIRDRDGRNDGSREPVRTDPVIRPPSRPDFTSREPVRTEPVRREPIRTEPQSREPMRIEPIRRDPIRTAPQTREPQRIESIRREPSRAEPRTSTIRRSPSSGSDSRSRSSIFEGISRSGREASSHSDRGRSSRSTRVGSGSSRERSRTTRPR